MVEENPPKRKQFSVRFGRDELRDLHQMASEEGMPTATYIRWLVKKEKDRRRQDYALPQDVSRIVKR